jgi:hypothetical protein
MVGPFNIIANGLFDLARRDEAKRRVLQGPASNYLKRRFSRESWPIAAQPINLIPRSISARISPRARSTPAWPAAARG